MYLRRTCEEDGAALLSVLLTMMLIMAITIAVMLVVQADLAAGIRQQQAVQVFNVAEAGLH
jgi:type II secretory pathway component PulK